MYAISGNSYRAISSPSEAVAGETVSEQLPAGVIAAVADGERTRSTQAEAMRAVADQALANLRTYRDLASPTNAQTVAAVKLLCRVCISLIRLALAKHDATD